MTRTVAIFFCLTFFLIVHCVKKEEIHLYVEGGPEIIYDYCHSGDSLSFDDAMMNLDIYTDPKFDTLYLSVNDDTLAIFYDNYKASYHDRIIPEIKEYTLKISSDIGTATASCRIPEPFKIISPGELIPAWNDCEFIWHKAKNAQWYRLYLAGGYNVNPRIIDTKDTSVIVEGAFFNQPGDCVEVFISAIHGVAFDDDDGNISGNGIGQWQGILKVHETLEIRK